MRLSVRCCFISPFARAQIFAKSKSGAGEANDTFKEAASLDYPFGPETIIHIPGIVR
jgi:hypothetical protein